VTGSKALGNDLGIEVGTGALSSENQILANVISASNRNGVLIRGDRNIVRGNVIGTDASGTKALGNAGDGVLVGGGSGNLIGGTTAAARNVISGNGGHGMHLTSAGNLVQGNYIGTDAAGRFALGNGGSGVIISASSNTVGGTEPGMGNVISGNGVGTPKKKFGVLAFGASDIKVQGNLIGTDAGGTYAIPNGPSADGVNFFDVTDGLIGGTTGSARNLISGNSGHGISFGGNSRNNAIDGNYIGVDASGMTELPNALAGINFFDVGVTDNAIGGKLSEKRNLISGNGGPGVILGPGSVEGGSNHLIGNYIGTDTLGAAAVPNAGPGVVVRSPGNEIRGNVISGNSANSGIHITTKGNRNGIWGNLIGTNAAGTAAVPNLAGIVIAGAGNDNVIGATEPPGCAPNLRWLCANVIAFNARTGVAMVAFGGTTPERNRVSGNAIFSNGELGIDLNADGVTPNDPGDVDAGPNGLQNFPVLRIAQLTPLGLRVAGSIDTPAPQTILIELFANRVPSPGGDPSGYGEGAEFLGTATPGADGGFSVNLPSVPGGTLISATATDAAGNTSEFAANIAARAPGRP
jgi:titin